jgi:hypothetical protein
MMDAGVVDIKERIWMMKMEYSVLKEEMKDDECGWSQGARDRVLFMILSVDDSVVTSEVPPRGLEPGPRA